MDSEVESDLKLLVLGDNHGRWQTVQSVLKAFKPQVDYVLHTGDSEFPADDPLWDDVDAVVSGNMDFDPQYRKHYLLNTDEGKIAVVHGHRHGVNQSNKVLFDLAAQEDIKFIFHGHTHRLYADYQNGILIVNPGSLNQPRGQHPYRTFAVVAVNEKEIEVCFYDDELQLVDSLTQTFKRK